MFEGGGGVGVGGEGGGGFSGGAVVLNPKTSQKKKRRKSGYEKNFWNHSHLLLLLHFPNKTTKPSHHPSKQPSNQASTKNHENFQLSTLGSGIWNLGSGIWMRLMMGYIVYIILHVFFWGVGRGFLGYCIYVYIYTLWRGRT